jgi:hypothetical protein
MSTRSLLALCCIFLTTIAAADVVIRAPALTAVLTDEGLWKSLQGPDGRELCVAEAALPFAQVSTLKGSAPCSAAKLSGSQLTLGFAKTGSELVYEVTPGPKWLVLKLVAVSGERPTSLTLCQIPVNLTEKVGRRLSAAYDGERAVCLMAANHQADCGASRPKEGAILRAATQDAPGPKLEGAACALIVCPTPQLKPILREASHAFGLLTNEDARGLPAKDGELRRGSYWFLTVGEKDADELIRYCQLTGFKQVMMGSGSWCRTVGHYTFNESRFKDEAALKAFVGKLHAAGILVGMHCFASKVSKTDAYVTPVPDRRFWVDRRDTLAADITADAREITVRGDLREWAGSPVAKQKLWEGGVDKHREVILDDEIIQYEAIGPEGVWNTFQGCKRGAWGTQASPHTAGTDARHYGVDGCINGYIIDQETTLLDETTTRLASIFNNCGFDMIYFDGGEDVDRTRFNFYVSNFQATVMRKIRKRPIIHMGTIMTHLLWHSFARSSTVDVYLATLHGAIQSGRTIEKWPTVREHINRSVDYMLSVSEDMMPGELGWFGIWPKQKNTDGLQLDETEYLMCKSLAYDVPISLETSFGQMESHPLTPGILEIVRLYEDLRLNRRVDEATRKQLREKGKDFALIVDGQERRFVPVTPLDSIAGGPAIRGEIGPHGAGSVATLWHYAREGDMVLALNPRQVRVLDLDGKPVASEAQGDKVKLHVGVRRLALISPLPVEQLRQALAQAEAIHRPVQRLWIQAETGKLVGEMALGSQGGVTEPGSFGDFVVCTAHPNFDTANPWYAEYTVNIPREGLWTLWARVMYPGGGDMSFGLWIPPDPLSLDGGKAIGNCGIGSDRWHWTGRGGGSTSEAPGAPITLRLPQGPLTFRVAAREGRGTAATNPRLDALMLTDEPDDMPTDELAQAALRP